MSTGKDAKQSRKIREFEWYQVETKVREIMSELLQPFNKKQTEDTIKINEIKRTQAALQKKIEEHDFLLDREHPQKPTYLQLQDDKILTIAQQVNQTHLDTHAAIARMDTILAAYQQKINQLTDLQRRVDKEVLERVEEFSKLQAGLQSEMEAVVRRQEAQVEEANQFRNLTRSSVNKMETRMISFDNRLKQLQDSHKHTSSDLRRLLEDTVSLNERMSKFDLHVADLASRVQDREKDTKLSQKFLAKVKELQTEMRFQATFLEQYQPLYVQMMISDTLDSFLEGHQRRKLCIFEEKKFASLHHHILVNQKLTLEDMMSTYSNQIRKIINRNKKYVINLAVAESVRHGGNLYEFRIENIADYKQQEETSKKVTAAIDPQQITKVVQDRLQGLENQVKEIIAYEINPTRTWMSELQEQLLMRSLEWDRKYAEIKKQTAEMSTRLELEQKHSQSQLSKISKGLESVQATTSSFKDYVKDILNFSSVINHIVIQDEIDRQGTALYALRSKQQGQPQAAFQLDPNCISCESKSAPIVQQAFKMACLTYNPSQIRIDEQMFSRQEILQISTGILQKLKKKLLTTTPNSQRGPISLASMQRAIWGETRGDAKVSRGDSKRRSVSTLKEGALGRSTAAREMQTLLPLVGRERRDRKGQLSVFY